MIRRGNSYFRLLVVTVLISIGLSVFLSGCGGGGSPSQLETSFRVRWSRAASSPDGLFSRYVVSGPDDTIYAFAISDPYTSPYIDTVYALNPKNGGTRWKFSVNDVFRSPATRKGSLLATRDITARKPVYYVSDRTIVFRLSLMYQSALCGVDVSTGKLRWSQNIPTRDFDQVGNRIAVVDSLSPREIRLMDPDTGDTVNRVAWSGENDIREVDGLPDALLVHDRRQLACFDALTGTQRWIIPYTGSYSSSGQSVFTAPGRSEIYAAAPEPGSYFFHLQRLDSHTGQELWRTEQLQGGEVHAAVASDGAALLWDNGSRLLQVLDAESGEKRWGFPLKGDGIRIATHGQGVATGARGVETAYVISSDYAQTFAGSQPFFGSVLVALNLNTGQERWRIGSPKRELYGPPVLTSEGGLIFVEGKNVVCLEAQ